MIRPERPRSVNPER